MEFSLSLWLVWLLAAALLIVIEIFTTSAVALCIAIGAIAGFVAGNAGGGPAVQLTLFVVLTVAAFLAIPPLMRRYGRIHQPAEGDRSNMDAIIGRTAILHHELSPGHLSRIRIDGDNWQARSDTDRTIPAGTTVKVTAYNSIILTVTPIN